MNVREAVHALAVAANAIGVGTIVFAGLSTTVTQDIAAVAMLISLVLNTYLGSTTTGFQAKDITVVDKKAE